MRDTARGETIQLDAAQGVAEPTATARAVPERRAATARRVFFTDKQRLTADSTAEPAFPGKPDLYECEIVEENGKLACHLKDLTVDHNEGEHAAVQGFVFGASEDGTSVYLVAQGVLADNENGNGEAAACRQEQPVWAALRRRAVDDDVHRDALHRRQPGVGRQPHREQRLPDGARLAERALSGVHVGGEPTGYDNVDANPEAKGARDEEVYLYDSAAASLRCVSCNPTGARPTGVLDQNESGEGLGLLVDRRKIWLGRWLAGNIPGWTAQSLVERAVPVALSLR